MRPSPDFAPNRLLPVLLVFGSAALWAALRYPTPIQFLTDADGAYQLVGAQAILAGEHPFVDFQEFYGPLTFYVSAVGQKLSGGRIIGEFLLVLLGYAMAYVTLFQLFIRAGKRPVIALVGVALALLMIPKLYKYYIVLCPAVSLLTMFRYLETPSRGRLYAMSLAVAVTGLYRPDFGSYALLAGAASIWLAADDRRTAAMLWFAGFVLLNAAPWLLWVAAKGGLGTYLLNSTGTSWQTAQSIATPLPPWPGFARLFSAAALEAMTFRLFLAVPALAAGMVYLNRAHLPPLERRQMIVASGFAQLALFQSLHRSDWGHLLQAAPLSLVVLAWLAGCAWTGRRDPAISPLRSIWPGIAAAAVALCAAGTVLVRSDLPRSGWSGLRERFSVYSGARSDVIAFGLRQDPDNWIANTARYVSEHSAPSDRLIAFPFFPQLNYLSGRPMAGGQMAILPGYFSSEAHQTLFLRRLSTQRVGFLLYWPNLALDNQPERAMEAYAPRLTRHFAENFQFVARFGPMTVSRPVAPP